MNISYGLPYKGSKNKLASRIFKLFPRKKNFYDLFCGGCAMTHYGMLHNKFKNFFINDLNPMCPNLFTEAINGKYRDEKRWISREDFFKLKDTDAYVAICWSFGNNLVNYLYCKEIEPWKKALHHARVYGDFSLMEEFSIRTDGTAIDIKKNAAEYKEKYIRWYLKNVLKGPAEYESLRSNLEIKIKDNSEKLRAYLLEGLRKAGKTRTEVDRYLSTNGMAGHYFRRSRWEFPTREVYIKLQSLLYLPENYDEIYSLQSLYERLQRLQRLQSLQSLQSLESLERLQRLQRLQGLESLERLQSFSTDYQNVKIYKDSVIYCDIPYEDTDGYTTGSFDYERFYSWCEKQTEPLFISSYRMPEDRFVCIATFKHKSILSATANNKVLEKVFIPKHQASSYSLPESLFDFDDFKLFEL